MAFAYSGGVITQTGTDTSLAGLVGLTGVTTEDRGDVTQYILNATVLNIEGNLSFNATTESIRFTNMGAIIRAFIYVNAATLTIDSSKSVNFVLTYYPDFLAIDFGQVGSSFLSNPFDVNRPFLMNNSSTVTLRGLYRFGNPGSPSGARIFIGSAGDTLTIDRAKLLDDAATSNTQVRASAGTLNVTNSVLNGISITLASGNLGSFTGTSILNNNETIVINSAAVLYYQFSNLDDDNAGTTIRHNNSLGAIVSKLINPRRGNAVSFVSNHVGVANHRVIIENALTLNLVNAAFSPITGKAHARDVNNGNRGPDFTANSVLYASSGDLVYSGEGSSLNFNVISAFYNSDQVLDARGVAGSGNIQFNCIAYANNISSVTPTLTGTGTKVAQAILPADTSITEANKSTVDAYTEITTAQRFYDRAKAYLYNNYAGETSTIVTRSENTIHAGARNVTIDPLAGSAFAVDGSGHITIAASTFAGNIVTTGTVTLLNGAVVSGFIQDVNGQTATLKITGLTGQSVYVENDSGVQVANNISVTGTFMVSIAAGATGTWKYVINDPGYIPFVGSFEPIEVVTIPAPVLVQMTNPDGTALYQGGNYPQVSVSFVPDGNCTISFSTEVTIQQVIDATQQAYDTANGMAWLARSNSELSGAMISAGDFLFLPARTRLFGTGVSAALAGYAVSADNAVVDPATTFPVRFVQSPNQSGTPAEVAQAVWEYVTRSLTADPGASAHAATQAAIAALNNLSAADVNAQVDLALADYDGPTKAELDAAQSAITTAISGLNDVDAAAVAQAVWNYLQSNATVSGSLKEAVQIVLTRSGLIAATV